MRLLVRPGTWKEVVRCKGLEGGERGEGPGGSFPNRRKSRSVEGEPRRRRRYQVVRRSVSQAVRAWGDLQQREGGFWTCLDSETPETQHPTDSRAGSQIEKGARRTLARPSKTKGPRIRVPASLVGGTILFSQREQMQMKGSRELCKVHHHRLHGTGATSHNSLHALVRWSPLL